MIDFKNKDEQATNLVMLGSLVVFLIAGAAMVFTPKPILPDARIQKRKVARLKNSTLALKKKGLTARADLASLTWAGSPDDLGPQVLKVVNTLIISHHLKLVGFHSDKPADLPNLTLIPYIFSVDGSYTNALGFVKDLEKPGTKLAVNLLQISNADQSDDKVTASIGITAYQLPKVPDPAADSSASGAKPSAESTGTSAKPEPTGSKGAKKHA